MFGIKAKNAVLNDEKAVAIYLRWHNGESTRVLAEEHGVSVSNVIKIVNGKTWERATRRVRRGG